MKLEIIQKTKKLDLFSLDVNDCLPEAEVFINDERVPEILEKAILLGLNELAGIHKESLSSLILKAIGDIR